MSEPQTPETATPPPPPVQPPAKKKFSPLAWILVGCLVILLLGALVTFTCTAFVAKKVKDVAEDMSENPAMAAAEMVVRVSPDLELVDKDEEAQTLTIRNKKTGETVTFDLEDVTEGRLRWETDGQEVVIDAQASGEEGGVITVTDESGEEETLTIGSSSADKVPAWVPIYPGVDAETAFLMTGGDSVQGTLSFETAESPEEVAEYYRENLEQLGFEVETSSFSSNDVESRMLSANDGASRTVYVNITTENGAVTNVGLNFSSGE
jgi:hypothetical protein